MSEQNTSEQTNVEKPKRAPNGKRYRVGQLAVERAKARNIDTSRAAKEIRGKLRANFDTVCKLDPSIKKAKSAANDGNRWPAMNEKVREFVLKGKK